MTTGILACCSRSGYPCYRRTRSLPFGPPLRVSEHEANTKAVNALFAGISRAEFSRVQGFQEAHKVWTCLENYHEGTPQVKARLFETHRREYENFTQGPGESIGDMFSRFQSIVNKVNANRSADTLDYTEHEKALKLLYALDRCRCPDPGVRIPTSKCCVFPHPRY